MYLDHFGLREAPFAITPDPRFVVLSERHREALAHLRYGIEQGGSGGFVLLTGDIGTGKTTLSRLLLEQLPPNTRAALLLNPRVNAIELLESLIDELGIARGSARRGSSRSLVDALNAHLLAAHARGEKVVVVIDEAQNLSTEALEQVRLLTNLETATAKLLQVVLLGQPELRDVLAREDLAQLAQRITARYHLSPLDAPETETYLRHRLAVAGSRRFPFTAAAVRALHARAGGVPRRINIIADRALTGAYAHQANEVGKELVQRAADEALGESSGRTRPWLAVAVGGALVIGALILASTVSQRGSGSASAGDASSGSRKNRTDATAPRRTAALAVPSTGATDPGQSGSAQAAPLQNDAAWRALLAAWNVPLELAANGCQPELAAGIHCLESVGSLERLRRLGAPVLVTFELDGERRHLLLHRITDLTLGFASASASGASQMPRDSFEERWLGEFRAVWRVPPELSEVLFHGARGAGVEWLERALVAAGVAAPPAHVRGLYDLPLAAAVRTLQRRFGLLEDGVAGRETQWILASRLAASEGRFADSTAINPGIPPRPLDSPATTEP